MPMARAKKKKKKKKKIADMKPVKEKWFLMLLYMRLDSDGSGIW